MDKIDLLSHNAMISLINLLNNINDIIIKYRVYIILENTKHIIKNKYDIKQKLSEPSPIPTATAAVTNLADELQKADKRLQKSIIDIINNISNKLVNNKSSYIQVSDINKKKEILTELIPNEKEKENKIKKINDFFIKHPFLDWDTFLRNSPNIISELFLLFATYEFFIHIPHILKEFYKLKMMCDRTDISEYEKWIKQLYNLESPSPSPSPSPSLINKIAIKLLSTTTPSPPTNKSYTGIINNLNKVITMHKKHFEI